MKNLIGILRNANKKDLDDLKRFLERTEEPKKDILAKCDFCSKEILLEKAYISAYGGIYCDKDCYVLFTED